jgi:hypothetical protein
MTPDLRDRLQFALASACTIDRELDGGLAAPGNAGLQP